MLTLKPYVAGFNPMPINKIGVETDFSGAKASNNTSKSKWKCAHEGVKTLTA